MFKTLSKDSHDISNFINLEGQVVEDKEESDYFTEEAEVVKRTVILTGITTPGPQYQRGSQECHEQQVK